jgi:hypothetical protein
VGRSEMRKHYELDQMCIRQRDVGSCCSKSAMKLLEALGSPSQPAYSLILPKGASIQRGSSSATIARSSFNSLTLASILALAKSLRGRF